MYGKEYVPLTCLENAVCLIIKYRGLYYYNIEQMFFSLNAHAQFESKLISAFKY